MRSPDFTPEFLPRISWHSIGSGADHEAARYYAEDFRRSYLNSFIKLDTGTPGNAVMATAGSIARHLRAKPLSNVSDAITYGIARLNDCELRALRSVDFDSAGVQRTTTPGSLAHTWDQFVAFTRSMGLSAEAAAA
jgi:hypothetical protein